MEPKQKPRVEPDPIEKKRTKARVIVQPSKHATPQQNPKVEPKQKPRVEPDPIEKTHTKANACVKTTQEQIKAKPKLLKKNLTHTANDEKHYVMLLSKTKYEEMKTQYPSVLNKDHLLDAIIYVNEDSNKHSFKIGCINPHLLKKGVAATTSLSFVHPNKPEEQRRDQQIKLKVTYFKTQLKNGVEHVQSYVIGKEKLETQMTEFEDAAILHKI